MDHNLRGVQGTDEHRAQLLIWQPLTKREHLKTVRLPRRIEDEYGAPPVMVWLGPWLQNKTAGGKTSEHDWGRRNGRQRLTGSTSRSQQQ